MALRVALNRTPREKEKDRECCECMCDGSEDFTAADMRRTQEESNKASVNLDEVKSQINQILCEFAQQSNETSISIYFCSSRINLTGASRDLVFKYFDYKSLEKIAAWLRNNGYYTDINMYKPAHGAIMASLLIYW